MPSTRSSASATSPAKSPSARPGKRTKMVKPEQQEQEQENEMVQEMRTEQQTPPKKRRKVVVAEVGERDASTSGSSDRSRSSCSPVALFVTPTKQKLPSTSTAAYLPTPPITPTISISPSEPASSSSSSSSTPTSSSNVYSRARSLLRLSAHESCSTPDQLVGRSLEKEQLNAFLRCHLPALYPVLDEEEDGALVSPSKALYVSGSPGTGKTATIQNVLQGLQEAAQSAGIKLALLNCATVQTGADIWQRLASELDLQCDYPGKGKKRADEQSFVDALCSESNRCLVVLDEIDNLLASSGSSEILSRLFSLAMDPSSNLVLIGIANALDLTQRYLHSLDDNEDETRHPELLNFRPFQSDEMVAIVKARLSVLLVETSPTNERETTPLPVPVVMPAALELAAKKVAAVTGDLRSFLSLIRKAVEIFEGEQRKRFGSASAEPEDSPTSKRSRLSPSSSTAASLSKKSSEDVLAHFDAITAPKLTPAHILKATRLVSLTSSSSSSGSGSSSGSATSGSSLSATSASALLEAKISELNLHQRLALTSFVIATLTRQAHSSPACSTTSSSPSFASETSEAMKPGEIHSAYRSLLEKDDVLHPVGSNEFSDLLSGLHTRGLVGLEREYSLFSSSTQQNRRAGGSPSPTTLAPPMLRRTSSSSSTSSIPSSSRGARGSRSPSPSAAQAPLLLLYSTTELRAGLRSSKPSEAASICSNILNREEKRIRRMRINTERAQVEKKERQSAPREGFHGNGLEDLNANFVGGRDQTGRNAEDSDEEMGMGHGRSKETLGEEL